MATLSVKSAYQFALGPLSEQEEKTLAAAFSAARKTANSWRAVDLQSSSGSSADGAKRFACLKPLVRRGIPIELRPSVWPLISGAAAKQAAAGPGAYGRLVEAAATGLPRNTQYTLKEDLSPTCFTFWTHPAFRNGSSGLERLQRLLGAYLTHNPGGYFRGLAHVAGFLLIVLGPASEESAFWVLAALMEDKLFPYCNGQAGYGFKVEVAVLQALVDKKLPKVAGHLAKLGTDAGTIMGPWLSSLLTSVLPSEVTARVFDALMLEGGKVLLRTGLALLKTYEATICAASHPAQLRKVLDARAARLYDGDALMATAFRGIGAMPGSSIAPLRAAAVAAIDAQLAEQRARLEMMVCRTH